MSGILIILEIGSIHLLQNVYHSLFVVFVSSHSCHLKTYSNVTEDIVIKSYMPVFGLRYFYLTCCSSFASGGCTVI
jgi:hypothetical protein